MSCGWMAPPQFCRRGGLHTFLCAWGAEKYAQGCGNNYQLLLLSFFLYLPVPLPSTWRGRRAAPQDAPARRHPKFRGGLLLFGCMIPGSERLDQV